MDSSVAILIRWQAGQLWGCGSNLAGTKHFLTRRSPNCLWGTLCHLHNAQSGQGTETLVGWWLVKRPERESEQTFIGEVKNKWSFNSLPYTPSYWVQRQFQIFLYLPWIVNEYTSQPSITKFTPFNIHYDSYLEQVVCLTFRLIYTENILFHIEFYKASKVIFTAKLKARIWTPFSVYLKKVFNYKQRIASIWKIREWIYVKSRLINSPTIYS